MATIKNDNGFVARMVADIAPDLPSFGSWAWGVAQPMAQQFVYNLIMAFVSRAMRRPVQPVGFANTIQNQQRFMAPQQQWPGQMPNTTTMENLLRPLDYKNVICDRIEADTILMDMREAAKQDPRNCVTVAFFYSKAGIHSFDASSYDWYWTFDELTRADWAFTNEGYYLRISHPHQQKKWI